MKQLSLERKFHEKEDKQKIYSQRLKSSTDEIKFLKRQLEKAQASWEAVNEKNFNLIGEMVNKAGYVLDWLAYLRYFHERDSALASKITLNEALEYANKFEYTQGGNSQLSFLSGVWERAASRISIILKQHPHGKATVKQDKLVRQNLRHSMRDLTDFFDRVSKKLILSPSKRF